MDPVPTPAPPAWRVIRVNFRKQVGEEWALEFMKELLAATEPGHNIVIDFGE